MYRAMHDELDVMRRRARRGAAPSCAASRPSVTGRWTNGTPRPVTERTCSAWLAMTTGISHGSSPDDQRTSRSATQCGWRDASSAIRVRSSLKRSRHLHAESLGDGSEGGGDLVAVEAEVVEVELDPLEEHRPVADADRVDVLVGVDDVAVVARR